MSNLCIIPARAGSKRILRKNIKMFLGKPIISYSIAAALKSKLFDHVMVSTDDEEIQDIAIQYGASVPFLRSIENSDDFSTTFDVIEEVILGYKKNGIEFEYACCIYPCAPFVTKEKLSQAYQVLKANNFDSVFPIMEFSFPIQRALKRGKKKEVFFENPQYALTRSQDLPKRYHDAGQFYWLHCEKCIINKVLIGDNSGSIVIPSMQGQDIDNLEDWKLAEIKFETLQNIK